MERGWGEEKRDDDGEETLQTNLKNEIKIFTVSHTYSLLNSSCLCSATFRPNVVTFCRIAWSWKAEWIFKSSNNLCLQEFGKRPQANSINEFSFFIFCFSSVLSKYVVYQTWLWIDEISKEKYVSTSWIRNYYLKCPNYACTVHSKNEIGLSSFMSELSTKFPWNL